MQNILIVGAGPTGLTAAIELTRLGFKVRIVDKQSERSLLSKALVINARTLELLEPAGVSEQLLAAGIKLKAMQFYENQKCCLSLNLANLKHRYNFLLSMPQSETEAILETSLLKLGVKVERNTEFISLAQNAEGVTAHLQQLDGLSEYKSDYLIGCDGASSAVRKQVGLQLRGITYPEKWQLADISTTEPQTSAGQMYILPKGNISLMLPLKSGQVRIIASNEQDIFDSPFFVNQKDKAMLWHSNFKIHCCQINSYQQGRVFLAGDAAHLHSPVGGRGMNLGIEDAMVLAQLMAKGGLEEYTRLRYPVGKQVLRITDRLTRILTLQNPLLKALRKYLLLPLLNLNFVQRRLLWKMSGLH